MTCLFRQLWTIFVQPVRASMVNSKNTGSILVGFLFWFYQFEIVFTTAESIDPDTIYVYNKFVSWRYKNYIRKGGIKTKEEMERWRSIREKGGRGEVQLTDPVTFPGRFGEIILFSVLNLGVGLERRQGVVDPTMLSRVFQNNRNLNISNSPTRLGLMMEYQ